MIVYKKHINLSLFMSLISLAALVCFEFKIDLFILEIFRGHRVFFINIFLGVFTGAIVTFFISVINYNFEKRYLFNKIYIFIVSIYNQIQRSLYLSNTEFIKNENDVLDLYIQIDNTVDNIYKEMVILDLNNLKKYKLLFELVKKIDFTSKDFIENFLKLQKEKSPDNYLEQINNLLDKITKKYVDYNNELKYYIDNPDELK